MYFGRAAYDHWGRGLFIGVAPVVTLVAVYAVVEFGSKTRPYGRSFI